MSQTIIYPAPEGAIGSDNYRVRVRPIGGGWQELFVYEVKVDMHNVRKASMAYFDMEGTVEVEIDCCFTPIVSVVVRPLSTGIQAEYSSNTIRFTLDRPEKLSIEVNDERFRNLHLFAGKLELTAPKPGDPGVLVLESAGKPVIHRTEDILKLAETPTAETGHAPDVIYFAPGMHYLEETILRIPSGKTVYIAGGAIVVGSLVCEHVEDVTIRGRGILYLSDFHRYSAFRGVRIVFSQNIQVEGLILIDPPHYSIYIGKSSHISISNFKSFSTRGWSDGIDMMASSDIDIDDVFLRTSDDCIAIYGTRWDYKGDTRRVRVRNSVLWADVAHPLMIGTHGDHQYDGDTIEDITFENLDILEHHEPQENYWGALAINAGDKNTVRHVLYDNIRVEPFEQGQLIDIRVVHNADYNPVPGNRIENITFRNVAYNGDNSNPNRIYGFDEERPVENITFVNLRINNKWISDASEGHFQINAFAKNIKFLPN
ncbi:Glycosyl hydrolases family 28 [Paenibacillus algorifonticola]|uniref:Glycosyl hydrolases family 28 n=1 Tax=Paenibacillus algorifonticola TaxID=684063 RepID=A0A1I2FW83_9BACL|nr:glycosyl hydrolase family 28 protein [Paenibacillus algorifonticola]SFF08940.1 Glycosyl hydrolases family 28 [Paenibacillus algorifonticola]